MLENCAKFGMESPIRDQGQDLDCDQAFQCVPTYGYLFGIDPLKCHRPVFIGRGFCACDHLSSDSRPRARHRQYQTRRVA